MTPGTILKMDRILGTPSCLILSFFESIARLFRSKKQATPHRIVFVKLIEMGSTVLACPAFEEATNMVGRDNIFFMAFKQNRAIVDMLPYFKHENIITIDDSNLITFAIDMLKAFIRIRREKIDAAIDMEGLTRSSAIITYLTGARYRVGYYNYTSEGPYRGRLFTHELHYNFQHHTSKMFLALVRSLKQTPTQTPMLKEFIDDSDIKLPEYKPSSDDLDYVKSFLKDNLKVADLNNIVLLNGNCSDLLPLRRWPTENFIELGKKILANHPGSCIAITGAPDEKDAAEDIAKKIDGGAGRVVSVAGHTTMPQLLALYGISRLLISNDSGPCHFASLTPISVIALFGPETSLLYSPIGSKSTSISANLACSPCVNILNHRFSPCDNNICMQKISIDKVYNEARKILDETRNT